jgi:hypothetical protein
MKKIAAVLFSFLILAALSVSGCSGADEVSGPGTTITPPPRDVTPHPRPTPDPCRQFPSEC